MSLFMNYPGLTAAVSGVVIGLLLIISRIKSARYEQESRAQWSAIRDTLQEQQQGMQELREQMANLSRFQGKSSKLLLNRIEHNARLLQTGHDELKQELTQEREALKASVVQIAAQIQPELAGIKEAVQQAARTTSDALRATEQQLLAEISGAAQAVTQATEQRLEQFGQQLEQLDDAGQLNQQLEQVQQQLAEQSGQSRMQSQQLGKILRAAAEHSNQQGQALNSLLNTLQEATTRQLTALAQEQAAIGEALQASQSDMDDAGISALQDVAQDIVNQIQSAQSDILSELKSVQHSVEEAVSSAEEELLSEGRSLSGAQYQLSEELEQHTQSANDLHLAAIADAAEDIQSQLNYSLQTGLQETMHSLQNSIDRVENSLRTENRRLAQALVKIQQNNTP